MKIYAVTEQGESLSADLIIEIEPGEGKEQIKQTEIKLEAATYNIYRSIIGGLYKGGYDEIKVKFDDPKIVPELQKTVDSLYGFDLVFAGV